MRRHDYSIPACAIGLILGRQIEAQLLNYYQISAGGLGYLLGRPIALVFLVLLIASLVYRPVLRLVRPPRPIVPAPVSP